MRQTRVAAGKLLLLTVFLLVSHTLAAEILDFGSASGRWTRDTETGAVMRLGSFRDGSQTVLRRLVFDTETLQSVDLAELYTGNARIRRAVEGRDAVFLYVTDGGSRISRGLYRVPRTLLSQNPGHMATDPSWLQYQLLDETGRVASHRDFDVIPADGAGSEDVMIASHRGSDGSQLAVYTGSGRARNVEGFDRNRITGDLRIVRDRYADRLLVSFRSRGQTEEASLHVGALHAAGDHYVYEEIAELPGRFFAVFGSSGEGPRSPLGYGSTYRDAGHDLIVLKDGSLALAYQYIEQIQSPLTRPTAGLVVHLLPSVSGEGTRVTVIEPQTSRFTFSPGLFQTNEQTLTVYWTAEQHPEFISDVFRADIDLETGYAGRPENLSANARMVSDVTAAGPDGTSVIYLQHEPRAGNTRVIVKQPLASTPGDWFRIPGDGVAAEDLAAALLALPLAALYGVALMLTRSLPALILVYVLAGALYRFAPELVRRAGRRCIPVLSCLYFAMHGIAPLSFSPLFPGAALFILAAGAALSVGHLTQRRSFPDRGSSTHDMMLPTAISVLVFNSVLAYPVVMETLAELHTFVY